MKTTFGGPAKTSMIRNPRVSIGLGVYNGEKLLRQTLDSILAQTFTDFELIISDNASSDGTEALCREYAARDARIKYSRNPSNIGLVNNFNRVFALSSGQYFRWSSADDLFAPTSLEECVKVLDEHPEIALCYPKTTIIDADGNVIRDYEDNLDLRLPQAPARIRLALENICLVNAHYGLIRRDVLRRTSLLGTYPGSDMALLAELALYGQFWEIPQRLFFRRMHEEASSASKNRASWNSALQYWTPTRKRTFDLYYSLQRFHNIISIVRAPISLGDKLRSIIVVAGYVLRSRHTHRLEIQAAGKRLLRRLKHSAN